MVAVIKTGNSIHRILNYNENKVKQGKAVCIAAGNYPVDASRLSFGMKLNLLLRQMQLNANVKRNSVHISLNFDISEKDMPAERLVAIADTYMQKLGFGKQPYLVYRHDDAGHPHIHLVTTNIEADGKRIDLHHLAIRKSEPARKEIEIAYGLVRAQNSKQKGQTTQVTSAKKAIYGTSQTRAAIQNVLDVVIDRYSYSSLAELNAVLKLYNVTAEPGSEFSRVNRYGGLLYRIIDDKGMPVGVPIKASLFYCKPTLASLAMKFGSNKITGQAKKARIKNTVDRLSHGTAKATFGDLENSLAKEGIALVKRESAEGLIYGITYIDHRTGGVFNGSALGKQYSAKAMQERFPEKATVIELPDAGGKLQSNSKDPDMLTGKSYGMDTGTVDILKDIGRILEHFAKVEQPSDYVPGQLKKRKKRKKKGPTDNH